ncbi:hypothetical protein AMAG_05261 [Allomyces macrogynus ATCC 38327]|uniref:Uncharacterized protein n=1 Tax=Allomyces macrogynus (strain ATCC 38327) TaxID=578462 RepID=A0A0L0SBI9_ALLM3|nr:hypothetical protein AMAG_05261 [Allomyces macrogynus ATCC 38327]|eukprot:KNE59802.1 hypothetical protein AMAG_05261 [Allomyces macrogynus ATCC 38327]
MAPPRVPDGAPAFVAREPHHDPAADVSVPLMDLADADTKDHRDDSDRKHDHDDRPATASTPPAGGYASVIGNGLPPPALDTAPWWSKLLFSWVGPLIAQHEDIDESTLNDLQEWDQAEFLSSRFRDEWHREIARVEAKGPDRHGRARKPSVMRALVRTLRTQIWSAGLIAGFEILVKLAEALFLGEMIRHFQTPDSPSIKGYGWGIGLGLVSTLHAAAHHHYFFICMRLGVQIRTTLIATMYRKAISLSTGADTSPGVVVNLISNDVSTFEPLALFGHFLWVAVIEVIVCTILLYQRLGWPSLLGLALIGLMVPLQSYLGSWFARFRQDTVKWRDSRVRLMTDLLQGQSVIKFNAWRIPFAEEVLRLRAGEMKPLIGAGLMDAFNEASWFIFPILIELIVFGTSYLADIPMTAADVFSSLALYAILKLTLTTFVPKGVKSLTESIVSAGRIRDFLLEQETSSAHLLADGRHAVEKELQHGAQVEVHHASFTWDASALRVDVDDDDDDKRADGKASPSPTSRSFSLDLNHTFDRSTLTAIIGPVGAGKSSLMSAILGEMPCARGHVTVQHDARIAYAPQTPWILAGTILTNITFGAPLDEPWLREVIRLCSLERDLQQWPHGLATIVGERGVALSGGQRARVGLARAIYARAPVLLLDDPLSAVDTRVARMIFDAVRHAPALQHTTRILVTHQLQFVKECDKIVVLDHGRIAAAGTWAEIRDSTNGSAWMSVLADYDHDRGEELNMDELAELDKQKERRELQREEGLGEEEVDLQGDVEGAAAVAAVQVEVSEVGTIKWSTIKAFLIDPTPAWLLVASVFMMIAGQSLSVASDWVLARWVAKPPAIQLGNSYYATLFLSLVVFATAIGIVRALLSYHLLLSSSFSVSKTMVYKVLDAPMAWFQKNPTGRILNKFTRDQSLVDEMLPSVFFNFLQSLFQTVGIIVVVLMVLPWVALSLPILGAIFFYLRRWYIAASRRIKRIESTTRSPVYSHLSESLDGLPVIRALRAQQLFIETFMSHQDTNTRSVFSQAACARWLGMRLDLLSAAFLFIAAMVSQAIADSGTLPAALAGLALSQSLQMSGLFQWLTRQSVECEIMFVAVERLVEYCKLEGELDHPAKGVPPAGWPASGDLKIKDMSLTYPSSTVPVLKDWTVDLQSGERIGVVGRTGAGKSSFFQALFRTYDYDGAMVLDGINTATLAVEQLRRHLSIIPQEPFLFRGTLRFNLDPFGEYTDADLWQALSRVELKHVIEHLDGKLDTAVDDGGTNFSTGQRQLICLARALLKRAKVLVADEATANIDYKTDALIQHTLKAEFPDTLVLTIAHRLSTCIDYDRIMVLDQGRIVECAHAYELLHRPEGVLRKMVADTGEDAARGLWDQARASWESKFPGQVPPSAAAMADGGVAVVAA